MRLTTLPAAWDLDLCRFVNRINRLPRCSRFFGTVSRLGDGVFWYAVMAVLPLADGWRGLAVAVVMLACGATALGVYTLVKRLTRRARPCDATNGIHRTLAPLDRFSFPSGHTMHAVAFTCLLAGTYPVLAWAVAPVALLIAASRLVLGLHYPSDVLVGALIGASLAQAFGSLCP